MIEAILGNVLLRKSKLLQDKIWKEAEIQPEDSLPVQVGKLLELYRALDVIVYADTDNALKTEEDEAKRMELNEKLTQVTIRLEIIGELLVQLFNESPVFYHLEECLHKEETYDWAGNFMKKELVVPAGYFLEFNAFFEKDHYSMTAEVDVPMTIGELLNHAVDSLNTISEQQWKPEDITISFIGSKAMEELAKRLKEEGIGLEEICLKTSCFAIKK